MNAHELGNASLTTDFDSPLDDAFDLESTYSGEPLVQPSHRGFGFEVGNLLQLKFATSAHDAGCFAFLLGWKKDVYLIAELPYPMPCDKGASVVVRRVIGGRVTEFSSRIVDVRAVPDPVLFIEYPRDEQQLAVRMHRRVSTSLPAVLYGGSSRGIVHGRVEDLSRSGCAIVLGREPPREIAFGLDVRIFIRFPGYQKTQRYRGVIRNLSRAGKAHPTAARARIGVEFEYGADEAQAVLTEFVEARLAELGTGDVGAYF